MPQMLKFVMLTLTYQKEIIKLAALKLLEFILETQGCSLDNSIVTILKVLIKTYPNLK